MKNPFLFGLMAILLLGGTITPALSQSTSDSVVINEVEINPLNGAEFVELYNPTSQPVDVSGWSLTPSLTWKNYVIISNTIIEPQSFAAFTHHSSWFKDFGDTISLTNSSGDLIDQTPLLADQNNDANTWQRNTDGLDTNSISDWKLKIMTPKSSNGIIIETQETFYSFTAQTEKTKYTFGEILKIYGSTTETLFKDTREAIPAVINIKIQGPNYYKTLTAYPDRDLNFSTTLNIKEVLGFTVGDYDVDISYGDNFTHTEFSVTEELNSSFTETESENLEIFTNKKSYLPGEIVTLSASTDSLIEYAGLDYLVLDPNGKQIAQGTIFPNSQFSIVHKSGGGQIYPFSTQFLMQSVQPVYGTYEILGTYAAQDPIYRSAGVEINTSANFELIEDVKEDIEISLSTDKEIYEVDEIVKITGRSNNIWTEDLELHIIQTGIFESDTRYQAFSPLNEKYSIKLNGDGTFEYDFQIPANTESGLAYGDYLIKVSEYFGQNTKIIKVVENSESFVDVRTNLGLKMDKSKYVLGTAMTISGSVLNYEQNENPQKFRGNEIKFTFTDSDGKHLMSEDRIQAFDEQYAKTPNDKLTFTAIPDAVGGYQINAILHPLQFDIGKYTVTANHYTSKSTESIDFEVVTAQSELLPSTETQEPLIFELCSSTRNDISEIMKDLKQIGKGEIPPSMESIDCDGNTDFVTGEKLVIRGQSCLKTNNIP